MRDQTPEIESAAPGGESRHEPAENPYMTAVVSEYAVKQCHHRVIAGRYARRVLLARTRGHIRVRHDFAPGARFVVDLWRRNHHGTLQWRCLVCEAPAPGEEAERIPQVTPGAHVLLSTQGAIQSRAFLAWFYDLPARGIDPLHCPAALYEAAHFRLWGLKPAALNPNALSGVL